MINYSIKPYISNEDKNFVMLFSELHQQTITDLADIVDMCEDAMIDSTKKFNWDWDVSGLVIQQTITTLTYSNHYECEFSTPELHKMLFEYLSELIRWNKKYQKEPTNYWFEGKWDFDS
jgi:hypothetical protein